MNLIKWILMPFALVYGAAMEVRNALFKFGILKSVTFDVPIISVGNLAVGGSGKTPFVKYLIDALGDKHKIAVLSRGYGRITKGYLKVETTSLARQSGDEPLEIKLSYPQIPVCVCENRVIGIAEMLVDYPDTTLIILDDAFQHQYVKPTINLILSKATRPFYTDFVMPAGRLREFAFNYKRADAIVFTSIKNDWKPRKTLLKPMFLVEQTYSEFECVHGEKDQSQNGFTLITGLANHVALEEDMRKLVEIKHTFHFGDHHRYTEKDLQQITAQSASLPWLTTHKDWVKLKELVRGKYDDISVYLINMQVVMDEKESFLSWVNQKLNESKA